MRQTKSVFLAGLAALFAAQALAGPLAVDSTAIIQGSTNFQGHNFNGSNSGLTGYVDWAVYAPGTFPAGFAGFSASDYVYAYQVTETGSAPLSSLTINLSGPADNLNIGDFTGNNGFGLVAGGPSDGQPFDFIDPLNTANWNFSNGVFGTTAGLAFSSPNPPVPSTGFTIDDSTLGNVIPVPSPGPTSAPEPGTLTLVLCGVAVFVVQWLRRNGRKVSL